MSYHPLFLEFKTKIDQQLENNGNDINFQNFSISLSDHWNVNHCHIRAGGGARNRQGNEALAGLIPNADNPDRFPRQLIGVSINRANNNGNDVLTEINILSSRADQSLYPLFHWNFGGWSSNLLTTTGKKYLQYQNVLHLQMHESL